MSCNVHDLCRLCASTQSRKATMVQIFSSDGLKLHLPDKINCHLPIKVVKDDGMPQQMCKLCVTKLNTCHLFISTCLEANITIQSIVNKTAQVEWTQNDATAGIKNSVTSSHNLEVKQEGPESNTDKLVQETIATLGKLVQESIATTDKDKPVQQTIATNEISQDVSMEEDVQGTFESQDEDFWGNDDSNTSENEMMEKKSVTEEVKVVVKPPEKSTTIIVAAALNKQQNEDVDANTQLVLVTLRKSLHSTMKSRQEFAIKIACHKNESLPTEADTPDLSCVPKFDCNVCSIAFSSLQELISHFSSQHPNQPVVQCITCCELLCGPQETLLSHQALHSKAETLSTAESLTAFTETAVTAFKKDPSAHCVMQVGTMNLESKLFTLNKCPPRRAQRYVTFADTELASEPVLKDADDVKVEYYCVLCHKSFISNRERFIHHLCATHFGVTREGLKFSCGQCGKQYTTKTKLKLHIEVKHEDKTEEVVCDECGKLIPVHSLKSHKYSHRRFECKYCHKMLPPTVWRRHKNFQENPSKKPTKNDKKTSCIGMAPYRVYNLQKVSSQRGLKDGGGRRKNRIFLRCQFCDVDVPKKIWMYHFAFQEALGRKACLENIFLIQNNFNPEDQNKFELKLKEAKDAWELKIKHEKCNICDKLVSRPEYETHLKIHAGDKQVICHICGKAFVCKKHVRSHIYSVHLRTRNKCQYCGKCFCKKQQQLSHEALHRGERNFKCPFCPKAFSGHDNVKNHITLVHEKRKYNRKTKNK